MSSWHREEARFLANELRKIQHKLEFYKEQTRGNASHAWYAADRGVLMAISELEWLGE